MFIFVFGVFFTSNSLRIDKLKYVLIDDPNKVVRNPGCSEDSLPCRIKNIEEKASDRSISLSLCT